MITYTSDNKYDYHNCENVMGLIFVRGKTGNMLVDAFFCKLDDYPKIYQIVKSVYPEIDTKTEPYTFFTIKAPVNISADISIQAAMKIQEEVKGKN